MSVIEYEKCERSGEGVVSGESVKQWRVSGRSATGSVDKRYLRATRISGLISPPINGERFVLTRD